MTTIAWCDDRERIPALVEFFVENVDTDYISHGELIDGRADAPESWSPRLRKVLAAEFAQDSKRLAVMEREGSIRAIALVEFVGEDAFLHDLVVAVSERGQGAGREVLEWVEDAARAAHCKRLFLESGVANEGAHRFFERAGYSAVSQVMLKALER